MGRLHREQKPKWRSLMKEGLHRAVAEVLAERGLAGLTVERVAKAAGIGKGTLYLYFADKQELLRSVARSTLEPLEEELERIAHSKLPPPEKLEAIIRRSLSYFEEHRHFFRVFLDPEFSGPRMDAAARERHSRLAKKVGRVLEAGIKAGDFRPLASRKAAEIFIMACAAAIRVRLGAAKPGPLEEDAQMVKEIFFHGVMKSGS